LTSEETVTVHVNPIRTSRVLLRIFLFIKKYYFGLCPQSLALR
jgi:hypothetical protein